jgi:hypothetical protein
MDGIARNVRVTGLDAGSVVKELVEQLEPQREELRLVILFADWRIDPYALARGMQKALPAPVIGCTTLGVVAGPAGSQPATAAAVGFYGDWLRVGVGIASDLPKSALARSRDAVENAASALGTTPAGLDSSRNVALAFVDGQCGHEEAFCIGSAAAAPQIRIVGGSASTEHGSARRSFIWANGEVLADAGVVVLLESAVPFEAVTSSHMIATPAKTVVTGASGRVIEELDGMPAARRIRQLVEQHGGTLDLARPQYSFARFVGGKPYVRSMVALDDELIHLASAVEVGHVLHVMRPGDLIGQTQRDLAAAAARLGGRMSSFLAFSCIARHWEAASSGIDRALNATYAQYPTTGFQSFGEQTGTLLVNHTLTGLAIGAG